MPSPQGQGLVKAGSALMHFSRQTDQNPGYAIPRPGAGLYILSRTHPTTGFSLQGFASIHQRRTFSTPPPQRPVSSVGWCDIRAHRACPKLREDSQDPFFFRSLFFFNCRTRRPGMPGFPASHSDSPCCFSRFFSESSLAAAHSPSALGFTKV